MFFCLFILKSIRLVRESEKCNGWVFTRKPVKLLSPQFPLWGQSPERSCPGPEAQRCVQRHTDHRTCLSPTHHRGRTAGVSSVTQHKTMRIKTFKGMMQQERWTVHTYFKVFLCLTPCSTSHDVQFRFFFQSDQIFMSQQFIAIITIDFYQTLMRYVNMSVPSNSMRVHINTSLLVYSKLTIKRICATTHWPQTEIINNYY